MSRVRQFLSFAVLGLVLFAVWYLALRNPARHYNLICLIGICMLGNLYLMMKLQFLPRFSLPARLGLLFLTSLTTVGFLRKTLLFFFFLSQGISLEEARFTYRQLAAYQDGLVYVSDSMWALSEEQHNMRYWHNKTVPPPEGTSLFILQNNIYRTLEPPAFEGYKLIHDGFPRELPRVLGIPVSASMPGYGFAAYVPVDKDSGAHRIEKED